MEGKYFAPFTTSQIFYLCLHITSSKEMGLGMNRGMPQSRREGISDDHKMHIFQSVCMSSREVAMSNELKITCTLVI